jgi:hypothetical protein
MLAGPEGAAWGHRMSDTHTHTPLSGLKRTWVMARLKCPLMTKSGRFETEKCGSSEDRFLTPKYATIFKYERFIW